MKKLSVLLCTMVLVFGAIGNSNAALFDLGNGLIYDDVLNISWLKDANLAATETFGVSGIDSTGQMTLETANTWITAMNAANYLGHNNWRLAKTSPVNGVNYVVDHGDYMGSTDHSFNISAPGSTYAGSTACEMAYMFFNNLGNKAFYDLYGNYPQSGWGLQNTGPFINLQPDVYWCKLDYQLEDPYSSLTLVFGMESGGLNLMAKDDNFHAWAVLDGNAIPIPGAIWLLGSGLIGLLGFRKVRNSK